MRHTFDSMILFEGVISRRMNILLPSICIALCSLTILSTICVFNKYMQTLFQDMRDAKIIFLGPTIFPIFMMSSFIFSPSTEFITIACFFFREGMNCLFFCYVCECLIHV